MASVLETLIVKLAADADDYKKTLDDSAQQAQSWSGSMSSVFSGAMMGIGMQITNMATSAISSFGGMAMESLAMASDLSETTSKVNTLFGESSAEIMAWAEGADTAFGLSEQAALDAVGGLGNMFLQLGAGTEQASALSQSMVGMAADLASFHNAAGGTNEVLDTMAAAFRGEYDSVQRFIPTINAANVEQKALTMTNKESAKELTALEKALAVQAILMEDAGAATGDFARTSEGMANQTRIMEAQWQNVQATLGSLFIPIATAALGLINDYMPALMDIAQGLADWAAGLNSLGDLFFIYEDGSGALMDLLETLGMNEAAAQTLGMVFYDIKGIFESVLGPVVDLIANFVSWQDVLVAVGAVIAAFLIPAIVGIVTAAAPVIAIFAAVIAATAALRAAWESNFGGIRDIVESVINNVMGWIMDVRVYFEENSAAMQSAADSAFGGIRTFFDDAFGYIAGWIETNLPMMQQIVESALSAMSGFWTAHGDTILALVGNTFEVIFTVISTTMKTVGDLITLALQLLTGDWQGAGETIVGIATRLWDTILSIFTIQIESIKLIFGGFGEWLSGALDTTVSGMTSAWEGFWSNWLSTAQGNITTMQGHWQTFTGWLDSHTGGSLTTVQGYWQSFSDQVQTISSNTWQEVQWATETGLEGAKGLVTAASQFMTGDWQGGLETLRSTAETMWGDIYSHFQTQIDAIMGVFGQTDWASIGSNMMQGIADGISAGVQWIVDAASNAAQAALDAAMELLGISSPSKVAAKQIGEPFAQGVGMGAERAMPSAIGKIQSAMDGLMSNLSAPQPALAGQGSGGTYNLYITLQGKATYEDGRAVGAGVADEMRKRGMA